MERWKKMRMLEFLVEVAGAGMIAAACMWGISQIESNRKHLTGSDFDGVNWIAAYNNSEDVRGYFEGENIPHSDTDYHLYEMAVRQRNGNPKSLRGIIEVPNLDGKDGVRIGYQIPHPRDVNVKN